MGGYERDPAPWSLDGIPAGLQRQAARRGLAAVRGADGERDRPRPRASREMEVVKLINGPEAFTPDGEFILGPTDVRGFWIAAGFCAHGLAGAGGMGKLVAEWIVEGVPSLDAWEMDSRRFGRAYRSRDYTLARTTRGLRDLLRREVPRPRAAGRAAAAALADLRAPGASSAPPSARSRAGSARTGSSRTRPAATSRCGRAAGPAGSGRPRSAPSTSPAARRRRSSTRPRSRRSRSRARAPPPSSSRCARTASRATSARSPTPQMLNRRGGIECDFTVTRLAEDRFRIVTGTAFGQHDLAWIRAARARGRSSPSTTSPRSYACLGLWGPKAREILQPLTTTPLDFPYMRARELAVGPVPVPRAARHLRRRARLGALLPDRVRPRALGRDLGGRAASTASSRAATRRSTRCGSRRATASGARTSRPTTRPSRRGSASRSSSTRASSSAARRCSASRSPSGSSAASCSPTRARSRSAPSRCASTGAPVGRVTSGGYGYTVERSIAYAYLPADRRRARAARSRWRSSASGSRARSPPSRSSTRPASACGMIEEAVERLWPGGARLASSRSAAGSRTATSRSTVGRRELRAADRRPRHRAARDRPLQSSTRRASRRAGLGIAPEVLRRSQSGYLVTRFVEGEPGRVDDVEEVARMLRRLHDSAADRRPLRRVPRRRGVRGDGDRARRARPRRLRPCPRDRAHDRARSAPTCRRRRATTTCSRRTSSTTASGSGSSTGSTRGWATRTSTWRTSPSTTGWTRTPRRASSPPTAPTTPTASC